MMRNALMAAALALGAMVPAAANASVIITGYDDNPGYLDADKMVYTPTGFVGSWPGMSRFVFTGTENGKPVAFLTYCADAFSAIGTGTFERADIGVLVSDPTRQQQLLTLLTHSDLLLGAESDLLAQKTISAATQLAVWEIISEHSGSYDTRSGEFYTVGGNSGDARALANSYLNQITTGGWTAIAGHKLQLLFSKDQQSQVFLSAVPEPASWATMIGGFALVGGMVRRKRAATARLA
ncbi:PEPxxWA-CTERM sorting domain-containing protein [Sphingomonas azotifigens]|uniref:PEPxxWA-CTERM sorting domain-containing protein n=1 Tax=Sphingomonas azotifigens TaxID=330920 RepID=UPI000A005EB1|nr:PEPxxWA-CTERM sorting domain-containing protein [Sphingomonas azotifigens]